MMKQMRFFTLALCLICYMHTTMARDKNRPSLLIGFYGGINFSQPKSLNSFGVSNNLSSMVNAYEKQYDGMFDNIGNQFGFAMFYPAFGNLHVGLLPSYSSYKYAYKNNISWDESGVTTLNSTTNHTQKLRYFEIPIVARYYIGTASFKPYVEGIFTYGMLHTADKKANSKYEQFDGATSSIIQNTTLSADYSNSYINSKISLGLGAGVSYDFNQLILMLGASYDFNLNNIASEKNRYSNDLFVGSTYDVQDNLNLHALKVNISVIFPINKITKKTSIECYYFKEHKRAKK